MCKSLISKKNQVQSVKVGLRKNIILSVKCCYREMCKNYLHFLHRTQGGRNDVTNYTSFLTSLR